MSHTDSAPDDRLNGALARLLEDYRPFPGIYDEMMDRTGAVRGHWRPFLERLAGLGPDEINRRFAIADRYLRDSGVFHRVYEDPAGVERAWPSSHVPLIIEANDWEQLKAGLIQRARLLEAVLADAYGSADLVRRGRLPATLIAGNPEFIRPLVGAPPSGGAHLRLYAVDVGRGTDGGWWVLGDRTQPPSGAGYALKNRLALARALLDTYRSLHVRRLAPFFQELQAELSGLSRRDDARVCLLTPGAWNETYFEHAYLARYLGFLLVEGGDLTVRSDGVFIRTVSGLQRTEVLLRRVDADFADPLELNVRSRLGVPGLVQAARERQVVIVNALGSGLVEARAVLAFLPALAPALLREDLAIPNVATWWLGDAEMQSEMAKRIESMVIAPAFAALPGDALSEGVLGGKLNIHQHQKIVQLIVDRGMDFVVQEPVKLSTMPVLHDGRLRPRPFILRLFLTRVGDGWTVMPGGFVRIADDIDAHAVSLQKGGRTADAWVLSEEPIAETTLLPAPDRVVIRRSAGTLPSRAADNLFWVGRYIERTEATLRLVRALLHRIIDDDDAAAPIISSISSLLLAWSAGPKEILRAKPSLVARAALQQAECEGSLPYLAGAARSAASVIRDRFSPDAWRALTTLVAVINAAMPDGPSEGAMLERVNDALRIVASFSGLAQENMTQRAGWRFLELGRRIERGLVTCRFARQFSNPPVHERALDVLLELCDSQITYRKRYVMVAARAPVVDLVMLDPFNPRSVAYQVDRIDEHLAALPPHMADGPLSLPQKAALALATKLRTMDAVDIDDDTISGFEVDLMQLSDYVASTYLIQTENLEAKREALA
jgi:uncharacterized circularly permuted ATP-grasp superfamily protein/uncharacterized alpha-E superfamily protein